MTSLDRWLLRIALHRMRIMLRKASVVASAIYVAVNFASPATGAAQPSWDGWHRAPPPSIIRYRVFKDKVVALTGLSKPCAPNARVTPKEGIEGKIVNRKFANDGMSLVGIVIETQSGDRSFVNIDAFENLERDSVDLADRGWIVQGLQTMLRQGSNVATEVQLCGAAGRVPFLDSVHFAGSLRPPDAAESQPQATPEEQRRPAASATSVAMQAEAGTFVVPVQINGALTLNFTVDSGAADVSIPIDVMITMMRTGTLTSAAFLGEQTYQLADGSTVRSQRFVIRSLKVGDKVLHDVSGTIASVKGSPLQGQSFLGRFRSWSVDNQRHVLNLE